MTWEDRIYLDEFEEANHLPEPLEVLLIIKSQDQIERRERMIEQFKKGKIGRVQPRPISEGLLVKCRLPPRQGTNVKAENFEQMSRFPEPRHIVPYSNGQYLLTEIGRVDLINEQGKILDSFTHPYFAFLHTVVLNQTQDRILVASPGYDSILELDINTKEETWSWFGWDHGFNPNEDGIYFTNTEEKAEVFQRQGHRAKYIDPREYNEQGLLTAARTTHPNAACYNPYNGEATVIVSLGRKGKIIEIDRQTGEFRVLLDSLSPMPHGIAPYGEGWTVTNTTRGEFWILDGRFNLLRQIIFNRLPDKPPEVLPYEWLQQVIAVSKHLFVGLDANRGIIVCDTAARCYSVFHADPNWCMQDMLIL